MLYELSSVIQMSRIARTGTCTQTWRVKHNITSEWNATFCRECYVLYKLSSVIQMSRIARTGTCTQTWRVKHNITSEWNATFCRECYVLYELSSVIQMSRIARTGTCTQTWRVKHNITSEWNATFCRECYVLYKLLCKMSHVYINLLDIESFKFHSEMSRVEQCRKCLVNKEEMKMKKWKCVIFKCYSSEKLITLNILHEVVPTCYSFHSWVDWSNADKVSCSRKQHTVAGVRTVYLCIQKPTF